MKLRHFFLPHPDTHQKAHLLKPVAILFYIFIFLTFNLSISFVTWVKPGLLGVAANLNYKEIINLVNEQRNKNGLPLLIEDARLNVAAYNKAKNMYEENYWAHYSPSGKDPWQFITGAGYKFIYAGENLAKNFYSPQDVMAAWMASPTHRENILNSHYKDIGISVVEGTLDGQPTVLIVQEFGSSREYTAQGGQPQSEVNSVTLKQEPDPISAPTQIPSPIATVEPKETENLLTQEEVSIQQTQEKPIIPSTVIASQPPTKIASQKTFVFDPYLFIKNIGISLFSLLLILILIDLYIIRRRVVQRISSHHLLHVLFLAISLSLLINIGRGTIL